MRLAKSAITNALAFSLIACLACAQKFNGDSCFHQDQSKDGICGPLLDCPSALDELKQNKFPQTCGFDGTAPIVCCPTAKTTTTTTTTEVPKIVEKAPVGVGAKSHAKCREYAKAVNQTYRVPILSFEERYVTIDECGIEVVKLIVGGTPASPKEFPHMVAIGYEPADGKVYSCGGSLISSKYVLTAGHCLSKRDLGVAKFARVGDLELNTPNEPGAEPQERNIVERIPHPAYRPPAQYHDIALLRVETPFEFTAYVRPICLNTETLIDESKAIASGWGTTSYMGIASDTLMKVTLDFFTHDECKGSYQPNARKLAKGIEDKTQLCAGSRTEQKDTCQGDSGGPLQVFNTEKDVYCMYTLVGVTSFGKACGLARTPGIYTRVSHYISWIEDTVWP